MRDSISAAIQRKRDAEQKRLLQHKVLLLLAAKMKVQPDSCLLASLDMYLIENIIRML